MLWEGSRLRMWSRLLGGLIYEVGWLDLWVSLPVDLDLDSVRSWSSYAVIQLLSISKPTVVVTLCIRQHVKLPTNKL